MFRRQSKPSTPSSPLPVIPVTIHTPLPAPDIPIAVPTTDSESAREEDIIEIKQELNKIEQVETVLEKQQEAQQILEKQIEDIVLRVLNEIEQKNGTNRPKVPPLPALPAP